MEAASTSSMALLGASPSSAAAMEAASTSSFAMLEASTSSAAMLEASTSSQQPGEAAVTAPYPYLDAPGVRFVPTDQEIILCYLRRKLRGEVLPTELVCNADVYAEHPQTLTAGLGASVGGCWYVYTQRNRKYARGGRPSRSTGGTGRWKSVGKNTPVTYGKDKATIGYKNKLAYEVFVYDDAGGDSKSKKKKQVLKTEWKMEEFVDAGSNRPIASDPNNFMLLNEWVLCKISLKSEKEKGEDKDEEEEEEEEDEGEGEQESPPMLVDEQPMDTSPDPNPSQVPAGLLLQNGANWSDDSTVDSQVEGSGSGTGTGSGSSDGLQQAADGDPFGFYDPEPLNEGRFDHAVRHDPWDFNRYQEYTDTDSFGSRLRTPSDPDPMETPLALPAAYHVNFVADPPSSADGGLELEHAKASGDDDAGNKGWAARQ